MVLAPKPCAAAVVLMIWGCPSVIPSLLVSKLIDGAPCTEDAECVSGVCLGVGTNKTCVTMCQTEGDCARSASCVIAPLGSVHETHTRWCRPLEPSQQLWAEPCTENRDCATGICHLDSCTQLCANDCPLGSVCEQVEIELGNRTNVLPVCLFDLSRPNLELGPLETPLGGSEFSFEAPEGLGSLTIVLVDEDGLRVSIRSLISPDGTQLTGVPPPNTDIIPPRSHIGSLSVMVPASDDPRGVPKAGSWRVTAGTYEPTGDVDLIPVPGVIERISVIFEPKIESGGLMDLNVHLSPGLGFTAATATTAPFVGDLLLQARSLLEQEAFTSFHRIDFLDLPEGTTVVENGDETRSICRAHSQGGRRRTAINVALVGDLSYTSGHAGGSPGPSGIYGTPASCIVIEKLRRGKDTGTLLAHELGHYLGLRHTSEIFGGHDPISDTPECEMGVAVADCPDYQNLLFPAFPLNRPLSLTKAQATVISTNPTLYEIPLSNICSDVLVHRLSPSGFGSGALDSDVSMRTGGCGGAGGAERLFFVKLREEGLSSLEIEVTAHGFDPVVYAYLNTCEEGGDVVCELGAAGGPSTIRIPEPAVGDWVIVVDSNQPNAGLFSVRVRLIPRSF